MKQGAWPVSGEGGHRHVLEKDQKPPDSGETEPLLGRQGWQSLTRTSPLTTTLSVTVVNWCAIGAAPPAASKNRMY